MLSESIHLPKSIKDAENRFIVVLKEQLLKIVKAINGLEKTANSIVNDNSMAVDRNTKRITPNITNNVSSVGSYHYCYRCGVVVMLGINLQVNANTASGQQLLTGLPAPPARIACSLAGAAVPLRCYIDTDGSLKLDGASPSSLQWFDGSVTYITND